MKRDLLSLEDLTTEEIQDLLNLTGQLKKDKQLGRDTLKGKSVGLVFQKSSNRTRVSFEVGINQLGGNCIYLGHPEINLGVRESISDVSKTLSRYLDSIVARTYTHEVITELAATGDIPIINGLSDLYHPCQALADIFSIQEKFGEVKGRTVAYIGDGNNVCNSLLLGCAKVGIHVKVATPPQYEPQTDIVKTAQKYARENKAEISVHASPQEAVKGADVIYADVWVSMGQEEESGKRLKDFEGFQINARLAGLAKDDYIFMHCLPAHRGQEVTADVIDGPHSIVFDQAENRLHTQKAIMMKLLGG